MQNTSPLKHLKLGIALVKEISFVMEPKEVIDLVTLKHNSFWGNI